MPIILFADKTGKLVAYNPDRDARMGRWCEAPLVPDLCYICFDPDTLAHYVADGYREETEDGVVWRYGTCHRCMNKRRNQDGQE